MFILLTYNSAIMIHVYRSVVAAGLEQVAPDCCPATIS